MGFTTTASSCCCQPKSSTVSASCDPGSPNIYGFTTPVSPTKANSCSRAQVAVRSAGWGRCRLKSYQMCSIARVDQVIQVVWYWREAGTFRVIVFARCCSSSMGRGCFMLTLPTDATSTGHSARQKIVDCCNTKNLPSSENHLMDWICSSSILDWKRARSAYHHALCLHPSCRVVIQI